MLLMESSEKRPRFTFHITASVIALFALTILASGSTGSYIASMLSDSNQEKVDIGIEHNHPLDLSIEISTLGNASIFEITQLSEEAVFVADGLFTNKERRFCGVGEGKRGGVGTADLHHQRRQTRQSPCSLPRPHDGPVQKAWDDQPDLYDAG